MDKVRELTKRHRRLLLFIYEYKIHHPYSPDIREISVAIADVKEYPLSTSMVNFYLDRLEKDGLISFLYLKTKGKKHNVRAARTVHITDAGFSFINNLLHKSEKKKTLELIYVPVS